MRVPKRPNFDSVTLEAYHVRQLRREGARDRTPGMPRLDRTNIQRWVPVRKDDDFDVGLFKVRYLRIELATVDEMCLLHRHQCP